MSWQTVPLRKLITPNNRRNRPDLPLLSVVRDKGIIKRKLDKSDNHNIIPEDLSNYKVVSEGQFVINKMKAWQGSCGVSPYNGIVSPAYFVFDLDIENPRFFDYAIRSSAYVGEFGRISKGIRVDQWDLDLVHLKYIRFPLPPRDEQNQIVRYLDWKASQINKLINAKRRQIELLGEQRQVVIENEFASISAKYMSCRYLGLLQNGISEAGDFFTAGTPFVNYGDVYKNDMLPATVTGVAKANEKQQKTYSVKKGDIFFTRTSETIDEVGFTAVCDETIPQAVFSGFVIRFRPNKDTFHNLYAKYYFRSKRVRDYFTQEMNLVTRVSLGQTLLKNLPILLPDFETQRTIAQRIDKKCKIIDKLVDKLNDEITLLGEYRTRLISDVVTGKLDVRGVTVPDYATVPVGARFIAPVNCEDEIEDCAYEI